MLGVTFDFIDESENMVRTVTPLHGGNTFDSSALPYEFGDSGIIIVCHHGRDLPETDLFSPEHRQNITTARYAIEYDSTARLAVEHDINLILIAFSVSNNLNTPFIKFRYCPDDPSMSRIITETICYNTERLKKREHLDLDQLNRVTRYFEGIRKMEVVSQRLTNCIYFSYRAMVCQKWIETYMLLVSSIESLVSNNGGRGATKVLCERVSKILSKRQITESMIRDVYGLRSSMVHGRYKLEGNEAENLRNLLELQHIHALLIEEFVNNSYYGHYQSESEREDWLNSL